MKGEKVVILGGRVVMKGGSVVAKVEEPVLKGEGHQPSSLVKEDKDQ